MELTRKNIVWMAAIVCAIIIVACSLVAIQWAKHRRGKCELIDEIPTSDLGQLKNFASEKMDAIANFAGYLIYEAEFNPLGRYSSRNILPLTMEEFNYDIAEEHLLFKTDCSQIRLSGRKDYRANALDLYLIDVRIRSIYNDSFTQFCFTEPRNISVTQEAHYACHATIRYPCYQLRKDPKGRDYKATVAWLVVDNWEIELGGNQDSHRNGEFSKPELSCLDG